MPKERESVFAFGIELEIVQDNDLPLLMFWRNQPDILPFMDNTRKISLNGLRFWHTRIRQKGNTFAYIARSSGIPVGYAELKNVNNAEKSCEDGLIIFDRQNRGTGLSHRIMFCREIISERLGIRSMMNRIHFKNEASINFYKKYGSELVRHEGDFLLFVYEYRKRRSCMEKIAIHLGLYDEYKKYLGSADIEKNLD